MLSAGQIQHYANHRKAHGWIASPDSGDEVSEVIHQAATMSMRVAVMGSQNSFSDVFISPGQVHVSLLRMDKIIDFDPEAGEITVEAGVRICDILKIVIPAGFYITGLSGSYTDTIGGMVSSNCHGKDSWLYGNIGSSIVSLKMIDHRGETINIGRADERIKAVIGGLGALGIIIEVKIKLRKLPSGILIAQECKMSIEQLSAGMTDTAEYKYAWVDMNEDKRRMAILRTASFDTSYAPDIDIPQPSATVFGLKPSIFWHVAGILWNPFTYGPVNQLISFKHKDTREYKSEIIRYLYPMLKFPGFKYIHKTEAFYELQCLFPIHTFHVALHDIRALIAKYKIYSMISGIKWHKADDIYLSFSGDGLSLATSFGAGILHTRAGRDFLEEYTQIAIQKKGKFYLSKYPYLSPDQIKTSYPDFDKWKAMKQVMDPGHVFLSDRIAQMIK